VIYKRDKMVEERRTDVHGGSGEVSLRSLVARNTHPNLRLLTYMNVAPGASIGLHHHRLETEYYLLLKGSVTVDDNGSTDTLQPGDLLQTGNGQYHGLNNTGSEIAELLVFVVTHAGHPLTERIDNGTA
jgi:quercetin dioxygenase-like cupin family protein